MLTCPKCKAECTEVLNEWHYSEFHVKNIVCKKCGVTFRAYYKQNQFSHIIPNSPIGRTPNTRTLIIEYLRVHENANTEEIATALNLDVTTIITELKILQRRGKIVCSDISANPESSQ